MRKLLLLISYAGDVFAIQQAAASSIEYSTSTTYLQQSSATLTYCNRASYTSISTAPISALNTTNIPSCDAVYQYGLTNYLGVSSATATYLQSSSATATYCNQRSTQDCSICISTPYALGTVATLITPFRSYSYTVSTITARCSTGSNVVMMIDKRAMATANTAGTNLWSGNVTVSSNSWVGGTISNFAVPANYGLFLVPVSVSGAVDRLMIEYSYTKN